MSWTEIEKRRRVRDKIIKNKKGKKLKKNKRGGTILKWKGGEQF
jgi:hypothetical protein